MSATTNTVSCAFPCMRVTSDGSSRPEEDQLQAETILFVSVNDAPLERVVCSTEQVSELIYGRLFTEGIISSIDDIASLTMSDDGTHIQVAVPNARSSEAGRPEPLPLEKVTPIPWSPEQVMNMARIFEEDAPVHKATFGSHSCYVLRDWDVLYCCEDIGRHNAFDKAIGCALRDGIDVSRCAIFSSGRIPTDMVMKAIRARIPLLMTKAVPTDLTVQLAREYDLTLICSAHSDGIKVFNDPLGVVFSA